MKPLRRPVRRRWLRVRGLAQPDGTRWARRDRRGRRRRLRWARNPLVRLVPGLRVRLREPECCGSWPWCRGDVLRWARGGCGRYGRHGWSGLRCGLRNGGRRGSQNASRMRLRDGADEWFRREGHCLHPNLRGWRSWRLQAGRWWTRVLWERLLLRRPCGTWRGTHRVTGWARPVRRRSCRHRWCRVRPHRRSYRHRTDWSGEQNRGVRSRAGHVVGAGRGYRHGRYHHGRCVRGHHGLHVRGHHDRCGHFDLRDRWTQRGQRCTHRQRGRWVWRDGRAVLPRRRRQS